MSHSTSHPARVGGLLLGATLLLVAGACAPTAQAPTVAPAATAAAKPTTAPAAQPTAATAASPAAAAPTAAAAASPAAAVAKPAASPAAAAPSPVPKPADFPTKPITIITSSAPGGGMDVMARTLAEGMRATFPQPIVVENRTGAGGANALNQASGRPADGYTLVTNTIGSCILAPYLQNGPLNCASFDPVARTQGEDFYLFVRNDSPSRTIEEYVQNAKSKRQKIGIGTPGSLDNFVALVWGQLAGFPFDTVPFEGTGDALTSLLGGNVDMLVANLSEAYGQVEAKQIRMLGIASTERAAEFPDVPTLREKGWDVVVTESRGFLAPKGTPKDRRDYLASQLRQGLQSDVWTRFTQASKTRSAFLTPDEYGPFLQQQTVLFQGLIDKYNLKQTPKPGG